MLVWYIELLLLGPVVIVAVFVTKMIVTIYRVHSLINYCGIDMIDVLKSEPAKRGRMVFEKLNEISILLGYRNERLQKQMKDAGIIEDADDYGYDKITHEFCMIKFPGTEESETLKIEFIDFQFADLMAKCEKIRQVFEAKELLKKALLRHYKMVGRFMKT